MSAEVLRFIPLAGMLIGLVVAFAFDPTAARVALWGPWAGLLAGFAVRFGIQRYGHARR